MSAKMNKLCLFLLVLSLIVINQVHGNTPKGSIPLDSLTFDKMLRHFRVSLVKIDVPFPYGDKQKEFAQLAFDAVEVEDLLIGEVGVKDFGENDNTDIGLRFGANKDNFPVLVLFVYDQPNKELLEFRYPSGEDFTADNLKNWMRRKSGIYLPLPGCLEQFDKLADRLMETFNPADRVQILAQAEEALVDLGRDEAEKAAKADIYIKIMKKVITFGGVFVTQERERIDKIIAGKLSPAKKKDLEGRINVLKSFDGQIQQNKEEL